MPKKSAKTSLKIKGGLSSLSRQELKGEKTKEEIELISLLTTWHNNAKKDKYLEVVLR
ncbi:MAG: hypothetical protein WC855_12480 [Thermodesulfovibrionales bacterium]